MGGLRAGPDMGISEAAGRTEWRVQETGEGEA